MKKNSKQPSGAQMMGNGEKVLKKAQKNVAKVNGGTSPETVGKLSADQKLAKAVNKFASKKMKVC